MAQMTLTNESITFYADGIWVQPLLSDGFWYQGPASELLSILIFHPEIDIDRAQFRVKRDSLKGRE